MPVEVVIERPTLTQFQKDIIYAPERFTVTEAATKAGKTFSHLWWLYEQAHEGYKGYNYWWTAPVYGQAEIAFNRLRRATENSKYYKVNHTKLTIETPVQTILSFKSAEKPDNLYGDDVYAAVIDEFTRCREDAWFAIRSTLTKTGGKCKMIGNVRGTKNWGYRLALKAKNGEPNYKYFKITAYQAAEAGIITYSEIEQAQRDLPERVFKELYLAEATEDGSNPFGANYIDMCVRDQSDEAVAFYGVDLAKSVDFTVIIGMSINGSVCHIQRFQHDWATTKRIIEQQVGRMPCLIDSTGVGDSVVEELQRVCPKMQGYKFTRNSKQQLMEALAVSIQHGRITFPEGVIVDELKQFEYIYSRNGVKYSAPEGMHDDTVCALALANKLYTNKPGITWLT